MTILCTRNEMELLIYFHFVNVVAIVERRPTENLVKGFTSISIINLNCNSKVWNLFTDDNIFILDEKRNWNSVSL